MHDRDGAAADLFERRVASVPGKKHAGGGDQRSAGHVQRDDEVRGGDEWPSALGRSAHSQCSR
jgi:hypothetical protein